MAGYAIYGNRIGRIREPGASQQRRMENGVPTVDRGPWTAGFRLKTQDSRPPNPSQRLAIPVDLQLCAPASAPNRIHSPSEGVKKSAIAAGDGRKPLDFLANRGLILRAFMHAPVFSHLLRVFTNSYATSGWFGNAISDGEKPRTRASASNPNTAAK